MAITLADGLPRVLAHARLQLSLVQGATRALHGAEPPRARIARESTRLSAALTLLEEIPCLQTADVGAHAQLVMRRAALVAACVLLMEAEDRRADGGGGRELRRDRPEWQHLERMGAELRRLRRELRELVKQVNVGLVEGSVRAGYRVSRRELEAANERVQAVLGVELRLAEGLKAELEAQQGDFVAINGQAAARLRLPPTFNIGAQEWRATVGILL